jgi:hypothetical protein
VPPNLSLNADVQSAGLRPRSGPPVSFISLGGRNADTAGGSEDHIPAAAMGSWLTIVTKSQKGA